MSKSRVLEVNKSAISVIVQNDTDYINLTDMTASFREGSGLIGKWITNKNTLEYLGVWEKINNLAFNYPEFGVKVLPSCMDDQALIKLYLKVARIPVMTQIS